MLTVEDYGRIRRAQRDGMSIRAIARTLHHAWRKIREVLAEPEPGPCTRTNDRPAPRKQRHTRAQIFPRLRDEHDYRVGYDAVRRYVNRRRRRQPETFIPLDHGERDQGGSVNGQRLECDFGHICVDFPEGRRQVAANHPGGANPMATFGLSRTVGWKALRWLSDVRPGVAHEILDLARRRIASQNQPILPIRRLLHRPRRIYQVRPCVQFGAAGCLPARAHWRVSRQWCRRTTRGEPM